MSKKVSDIAVMDRMAANNMDIRLFPDLVEAKTAKGGGHVIMGVDAGSVQEMSKWAFGAEQTHYVVLMMVNKKQFLHIQKEMQEEQL